MNWTSLLISIHALREEGDPATLCMPSPGHAFLSTPSARRATALRNARGSHSAHFYPRPPRGGRPNKRANNINVVPISIHALREEGDGKKPSSGSPSNISIHALREEGDRVVLVHGGGPAISIHALREEGDARLATCFSTSCTFLSTPSARRATATPAHTSTS